MWFGLGGFLLAVGATLVWLVTVPVVGIGRVGLGSVLMVGGLISLGYGILAPRIRERRAQAPQALEPSPPPSS